VRVQQFESHDFGYSNYLALLFMTNVTSTRLLRHIRHIAESGEASELSDQELVRRFADGRNEAAFAALVRRHGAMVLAVCRRVLGHQQDAEDIFQAVFLVLSRKAGALRCHQAVGSWLFAVAHRLALRARQQRQNRREREARISEKPVDDVLADLTIREAHSVLDEELARLTERDRAPLVLCYLQGLTRDEAAQRLGCPVGTLKSRLERARALLQKRLTRRGLALNTVLATLLLTNTGAFALSTDLLSATVKAGLAYGGGSVRGLVGLQAAAAADGFLKTAFLGKIKLAALYIATSLACSVALLHTSLGVQPTVEGKTPSALTEKDKRIDSTTQAPKVANNERTATSQAIDPRTDVAKTPTAASEPTLEPRVGKWQWHADLTGSKACVRALGFSADGARLLSGADDGNVYVWDVRAAQQLRMLQSSKARPIRAVGFGADDTAAMGNDDGILLVWKLGRNEEPTAVVQGRGREVLALTFGDDGRSLAWVRCDGSVWNMTTAVAAADAAPALVGQEGQVKCVGFSRDGGTVAWGMKDGAVKLWDIASKKELRHFGLHKHQVWCVALSPSGQRIAAVDHFGTLKVLNVATQREELVAQNHDGGHLVTLAFSPDGKLVATAGAAGVVHLWDIESKRKLADLEGHRGMIQVLAFSPDGQHLASGASSGEIKLWTARPTIVSQP
jgi:RNA polymerase sigma factor (sigma-70 family)